MQTKEFNRWIKQLLPSFPGFVASKHGDMFCKPMNHILRGISFSGSSYCKTSFRIDTLVQPLYVPAEVINVNFGKRLRDPSGRDTWEWDAASEPKILEDIKAAIFSQGIPFFEKIRQPSDMADAAPVINPAVGMKTQEVIVYSLIYAERFVKALPRLEALCAKIEEEINPNSPPYKRVPWRLAWKERNIQLLALLKENPQSAKAKLEEWEKETIAKLKLEYLNAPPKMKNVRFRVRNGDMITLRKTDDGRYACPICGCLGYSAAWEPQENEPAMASFDVCDSCNTQYGLEDDIGESSPPGALEKSWAILRIQWLDRVHWNPQALEQLKNLDVDAEDLKRRYPFNYRISTENPRTLRIVPTHTFTIVAPNGDPVIMHQSDEGEYICPVCGLAGFKEPPWKPVEGGRAKPSSDICPSCHTAFGHSDIINEREDAGGMERRWSHYRHYWLDEVYWADWALQQLKNIGIEPDEMKRSRGKP